MTIRPTGLALLLAVAGTALLDRLLHHAHVLKCGPRSWRTKVQTEPPRVYRRAHYLRGRVP